MPTDFDTCGLVIDGIKCYAPHLAMENEGFPRGAFERLFDLEAKNFWFRSRNRLIQSLVRKYIGTQSSSNFLEIGCGTGFVLTGLSRFKNLELVGAEIYLDALKLARTRLPRVDFIQVDATRLPFVDHFDAIGAFDVLEHITEDYLAIENICRALKVGGYFFVSVPQHSFLWSTSDERAFHKRRYSRKELRHKLEKAGFKIQFVSSFVFFLFPIMAFARLADRKSTSRMSNKEPSHDELSLPRLVDAIFEVFMRIDESLINFGISLPWGGSIVVVARKA